MKLKHKLININSKNKLAIIIITIIFCVLILLNIIKQRLNNILEELVKSETTNISTYLISEAVNENINKDIEINKLLSTVLNNKEEIVSVDFNTVEVNKYLVNLNKNILTNLKQLEHGNLENLDSNIFYSEKLDNRFIYYIPYGIISDNSLLSNIGPKMPIKISLSGSVKSNINTEIKEYGINNSILKISINVEIKMRIVLPFISDEVKIKNEIPLVVKLINGSIPEVYGGNYAISSPITSND